MSKKDKFYAVAIGAKPGIYNTWAECAEQVIYYSGSKYKSFYTRSEAEEYIKRYSKPKKKTPKSTPIIDIDKSSLKKDQLVAFDIMCEGENVFVTGDAGTGKSYLLSAFLTECKRQKKNVVVCAPTGIAAINVGGSTIHKVFKIDARNSLMTPKQPIKNINNVILNTDILIIDEISMCRFDLFSYIMRYIKKAEKNADKKIQVIVMGDFSQLPPVITSNDAKVLQEIWKDVIPDIGLGFAFLAPEWKKMHFKNVYLEESIRQTDKEFINALTKVKKGLKTSLKYFNTKAKRYNNDDSVNAVYLCPTNRMASNINNYRISKIKNPKVKYVGVTIGSVSTSEKITDEILELAVGARVMSLVNDVEFNYQNGSLGTIKSLNSDSVTVEFDNGKRKTICNYTWEICKYYVDEDGTLQKEIIGTYTQIPLKIAYAITIHKAQGQTYDSIILNPSCFTHGQLYVALSRVKTIDKLYLVKDIPDKALITDPMVKKKERTFKKKK